MPTTDWQRPRMTFGVSSSSADQAVKKEWDLPSGGWPTVVEGAAREVLEMMLGSNATRVEAEGGPEGDIIAMVGLAGQLSGVVSVRCSLDAAVLVAHKMLGTTESEAEGAARDAMGEIANVVAGSLKTKVPGLEDACFLSTPTVILGHDFRIYSLGGNSHEVALEFDEKRVWFILDVHP